MILSENVNNQNCAPKLVLFDEKKINHFLWVCWFLGKNLSTFIPPLENSTTSIAILRRIGWRQLIQKEPRTNPHNKLQLTRNFLYYRYGLYDWWLFYSLPTILDSLPICNCEGGIISDDIFNLVPFSKNEPNDYPLTFQPEVKISGTVIWLIFLRMGPITCSWHQKTNSPILQFTNLKCCIKAPF